MHGVGDQFPAFDLRVVPETRRVGPAQPLAADPGRLGNDEPGARALGIVGGHELVRHGIAVGARPSQRRHCNSIGKLERAKLERIKKSGHSGPFVSW
jgi:hypothetical protein